MCALYSKYYKFKFYIYLQTILPDNIMQLRLAGNSWLRYDVNRTIQTDQITLYSFYLYRWRLHKVI
ncbi:hypothetical protein BGI15_01645 [Snodgrassella alvi]|nr:hypothetical protein BGI11_06085 [Snodgrassella alvi]ORF37989.1 hypothetical protein BGI13_07050 [Snodgrassella alvi]ORF39640.1 hypothetical protein BGI14_06960 [Snodgrassella alvi]ORF44009.1 hypothetical protein BGI15_01645 [Snodgrassella alvi]